MTIQLTELQQQALDADRSTIRIVDPRSNTTYYLVSENDYVAIQDLLEEERQQRFIHAIGLRNAAARMDEAP